MKIFITGAAGFIGSHVVDRFLAHGETVVGFDNFSTGQERFLAKAMSHDNFTLVEGDLLNAASLSKAMSGADEVWHFAANADVRFGLEHPRKDLEQNTIATANVLEAMRENGVKRIFFSSTGSIYGEAKIIPTPEDASFMPQTSLYAASKISCEAIISAYCEGFGMQAAIFRFVSILGERYTHGHVFDFIKQLLAHPDHLKALGDGSQRKSYLYVQDCVDAMHCVRGNMPQKCDVFNLGADEYCQVRDSIGWICQKLGVNPEITYAGGNKGWVGDNPFIYLDTSKIRSLDWANKLSIRQSVEKTADWLLANQWVFEARK